MDFSGRRFNRTSEHRKAMFANMSASLIKHEQIITTLPKAKDLRPIVEKLVTLGKKRRPARPPPGDRPDEGRSPGQEALRRARQPRYKDRQGGYLRIIKAGFRYGDNAPVAVIEFVDRDVSEKGKDSGPKQAKEEAAEVAA
jgi:large subunit ribosomal protein L17